MNKQQREILNKKLAALLGFEDGADDFLSHLLTIEAQSDVLDYLTQLLGMDKLEATRAFVRDVDRARRGQPISEENENEEEEPEPQAGAGRQTTKKASQAKKAPAPKNAAQSTKKENTQQSSVSSGKSTRTKNNKTPPKELPMPQEEAVKPAPPPRGKAKFDCGCFGTLHGALTNCLYCGRIACEREGYGFCPFCGYLVEEVKSSGGGDLCSTDEAWKHKERLLRYDREFAQRTVILDDQADYFNNQTSMWSTEEERAEAARQEQQRQDDIHKRKMQMNLVL